MTEIINNFTKENPKVKIIVSQGGSQDLYNSLKSSRKGDLYLPGSASYRKDNIKDGLLGDAALVGYNQAALVVKKGNPKHFTVDIRELATTKLSIGICNANSGSIGRMTKEILESMDIYKDVFNKAAILSTDSRNLTKAVKDGMADVVLNWKATAYWPENRNFIQTIKLSDNIAPKKKLLLNILTFSKEPELTKKFFDYATSSKGCKIFKKWGF